MLRTRRDLIASGAAGVAAMAFAPIGSVAAATTNWRASLFAVVVGQSNEAGAGVTPTASEPPAPPMVDPVKPNGGRRSWWPRMATRLAQQGVSFRVWNSAVGATSLARSWVGQVAPWRNKDLICKGSLIIFEDRLWKCVAAPAPVAPSTAPPRAADSEEGVHWIDLGPRPMSHIPNYVTREGDLGFDPNGYLSSAYDGFRQASSDERKIAIISIGQGDKTFAVRKVYYEAALASVAQYFTRRGVVAVVGFTSPIATPGGRTWFARELQPGWREFLDRHRGDPMVVAGADLTAVFRGELPVMPASGPGLQGDLVHMNDEAYEVASAAWADALLAWLA